MVETIVALAMAGAAGAAGTLRWYARRPWPRTRGRLRVPGLEAPVEVMRDRRGVPHVYASTEHDLFFAQGFLHAQDRLWQMDLQRRAGLGRLSELLGPAAIDVDRTMRIVGVAGAAVRDLEALDVRGLRALDAYADGVNAHTAAHGRRPLEYHLLRGAVEPWSPLDTLAWAKMLQWTLNSDWRRILFRHELIGAAGAQRAAELITDYEDFVYRQLVPDAGERATDPSLSGADVELTHGTNAWVVAGWRTATGKPLLANDTHLEFGMPGIWYEMGLHAPDYHCVGMSMPGTTGIVVGHNQRIAWGMATTPARVQDVYVERLNPDRPTEYLTERGYEPFEVRRELIRVRGRTQPVEIQVDVSRHGPMITDLDERSRHFGRPIALRWMGNVEPSTLLSAVLALNEADDWSSFTDALRAWDAPMQTFVYADVDGNIGSRCAGRVPIRGCGRTAVPLPGWDGEHEWTGTVPFEELPTSLNPAEGMIVAANSKPAPRGYRYFLAPEWCTFNRQTRIETRLRAATSATVGDMIALQMDTWSAVADRLVPQLLSVPLGDDCVRLAQRHLSGWDCSLRTDSVAATIFAASLRSLIEVVVEPVLGRRLADAYLLREQQYSAFLETVLTDPQAAWWQAVGGREAALATALRRGVDWCTARFGSDTRRWQWGRLHAASFAHLIYGRVPLLRAWGNAGIPIGGDSQTVLATALAEFTVSLRAIHGPVHRHVADLSDWDACRAIVAVGQSGHVLHPNYRDQLAAWSTGDLHPQPWTRAAVESACDRRLLLQPA
jgi:penicillin G amidase